MMETVIESLDGWMPIASLVRDGGRWWIVQVPDVPAAMDFANRRLPDGIPPIEGVPRNAPTAIFAADVEVRPVYEDVVDFPGGLPIEGDFSVAEHEDGGATFYLDGTECGTRTRHQVGETITAVTPIDADGDPINGLTPRWVLPAGTTFDDALDHILTNTPTPD